MSGPGKKVELRLPKHTQIQAHRHLFELKRKKTKQLLSTVSHDAVTFSHTSAKYKAN